jgi:hypothetical protein
LSSLSVLTFCRVGDNQIARVLVYSVSACGYRHEPQGYDESYESQTASRFSGGDNIGHYHQGSDYGYTGQWDGSHSDLHSNHSYRGHNQVKDGRTGNPSQPPGGASTAANSSLNSMSLDASSGAFQLRASAKEFVPSFVK